MLNEKVSLQGLWYSPVSKNISNTLIQFSCSIAKTFKSLINLMVSDAPRVPSWNSHRFRLNGKPEKSRITGIPKGIRTMDDVRNPNDSKLGIFAQLKDTYRYGLTETESKLELITDQKVKLASKIYIDTNE